MKRILSLLLIAGTLILAFGCEKERLNIDTKNETQFKADEEDDEIHAYIPTVHGFVFLTSGQSPQDITITFTGVDVTYFASTHPNAEGNYSFTNVVAGNYKRKTYDNGVLIHTINYIVE